MFQKFYLALAVLVLSSAASAEDSAMSAKDFQNHVTDNGGRVDFVFGADRPFSQCHASTIVQTKDGSLISAWFGGTREKNPDVGIWYSIFDGKRWSRKPMRAAKVNETAHWNPALFTDADGITHLFFKVGAEIDFWQTYWMHTKDNGETWSEPQELVPGDKGGRGPVRSKPIILSDGSWLAGASTEYQGWNAFADRSTDGGKTWERSANFEVDREKYPKQGAIQPSIWESAPGKVHALLRSQAGEVWRTDSADGGKTWGQVYDTGLPNPNSGVDALQLDDGRLFLVYNPTGKNWGDRTPLDLAVSTDNGKTWTTVANLEDDPHPDNEFSYPAIVATEDGIAVSYTWQRERIRTWQIPLKALEK